MIEAARGNRGWDLLFIVSIGALLVGGWLVFIKPRPAPTPPANPMTIARDTDRKAQEVEKEAEASEQIVSDRTWDTETKDLGSQVLDLLGQIAQDKDLKLTDLRTEKPTISATLLQAPYTVLVEGKFEDVIGALEVLEGEGSKLAVNQVNLSAGDKGQVSATISITGFLKREGA